MIPDEIYEIEKKYREYLPLPIAAQIIKLINYTRHLEKENTQLKREIANIDGKVKELKEVLSC